MQLRNSCRRTTHAALHLPGPSPIHWYPGYDAAASSATCQLNEPYKHNEPPISLHYLLSRHLTIMIPSLCSPLSPERVASNLQGISIPKPPYTSGTSQGSYPTSSAAINPRPRSSDKPISAYWSLKQRYPLMRSSRRIPYYAPAPAPALDFASFVVNYKSACLRSAESIFESQPQNRQCPPHTL